MLDATAVAALYMDDPLTAAAQTTAARLAEDEAELHVPQLMVHEVANAMLKAIRRKELALETALASLADLRTAEYRWHDAEGLASASIALADAHGLSAYDATYLALALAIRGTLVTGDRALAARAAEAGTETRRLVPSSST